MPPACIISACLAGIPCRYDGNSNAVPALVRLAATGQALPLCPEVLAGLPIPRPACELCAGRIRSREGSDLTEQFRHGAEQALALALQQPCRTAILKSRSPSCGYGRIYDGSFSHRLCPGDGLWAALLRRAGFQLFSEEDLPPDLYTMMDSSGGER